MAPGTLLDTGARSRAPGRIARGLALTALIGSLAAGPASATPPPDVPLVISDAPSTAFLSEAPENAVDDKTLKDQAKAAAESKVKPKQDANESRRIAAVTRTRHPGHACYGQTDNPHRSVHNPGYITVRGRTVCYGHNVSVVVHLYLWAFGSWYFRDAGSNSGFGNTHANASTPGRCGTFLGVSGHSATFHNPASTQNQATIAC